MPIRIYRLTIANTASGVGQASTTVIQKGTIVQVAAVGDYGAGASRGRLTMELALNNTSQSQAETATGSVSEQMLCRTVLASTASTTSTVNHVYPLNRRIEQGNILCINTTQSGTAANSVLAGYDVYVNE